MQFEVIKLANNFSLDTLEKGLDKRLLLLKHGIATEPIILFGAGEIGLNYLRHMRECFKVPLLFCDNNPAKRASTVNGALVISFDKLLKDYNKSFIIITSLEYYDEIYDQLLQYNLQERLISGVQLLYDNEYDDYRNLVTAKNNMFNAVYNLLSDDYSKEIFLSRINYCISGLNKYLIPLRSKGPQYFEPGIIHLSDKEVFIDGGAYTGDTAKEFVKQTSGHFKKVYSFEPEETKHSDFWSSNAGTRNIELIPYGLWSSNTVLCFDADNNGGSRVNLQGATKIQVKALDELLGDEQVTFIKLDVEGAELEALKGAAKCIRRHKPKLAICIYHKALDIVEIPLYLHQLLPEYNIYLRHYSVGLSETVCYAVPR
jgi:FkbM family methyltransferase